MDWNMRTERTVEEIRTVQLQQMNNETMSSEFNEGRRIITQISDQGSK